LDLRGRPRAAEAWRAARWVRNGETTNGGIDPFNDGWKRVNGAAAV
jgi:hypothetical protein